MLWYQCLCAALRVHLLWIKVMVLRIYDHLQGPNTFITCWAICMKLKMLILITLVCWGLHRNLAFRMPNEIHRIWLFCLFVFSRIHSYGNVIITGEGLQILTYTRHWWPLSSEGYLACQTYSDTGIRSSPRTSDASSHLFPSTCSEVVTTCSNDLRLSRPGIEPRSPACEANALQLSQRGGSAYLITNIQLLYTGIKCKFHFTWV